MTKITKFDARFRKAANAVAQELGLNLISTPRQIENGTLMWYDEDTNTKYSISESGYVRRFIKGGWPFTTWAGYQLNPTTEYKREGRTFKNRTLVSDPNTQLGIMIKAVVNYRNQ